MFSDLFLRIVHVGYSRICRWTMEVISDLLLKASEAPSLEGISGAIENCEVLNAPKRDVVFVTILPFEAFAEFIKHTRSPVINVFVRHYDYINDSLIHELNIVRPKMHDSIITKSLKHIAHEKKGFYCGSYLIQLVEEFNVKNSRFLVKSRKDFVSKLTITSVGREFKMQFGNLVYTVTQINDYIDGKFTKKYTMVKACIDSESNIASLENLIKFYLDKIVDSIIDDMFDNIEVESANYPFYGLETLELADKNSSFQQEWKTKEFWDGEFYPLNLVSTNNVTSYGMQQFNKLVNIRNYSDEVAIELEFTVKFKGSNVFNFIMNSIPTNDLYEYFRLVDRIGKMKFRNDVILHGDAIVNLPNGKIVCHESINNMSSYKESLEADFNTRNIVLTEEFPQFPSKKSFLKHSIVAAYKYKHEGKELMFTVTLCKKITDEGTDLSTNLEFEFDSDPEVNVEIFKQLLVDLFNKEDKFYNTRLDTSV